jgi:hypothetical protein
MGGYLLRQGEGDVAQTRSLQFSGAVRTAAHVPDTSSEIRTPPFLARGVLMPCHVIPYGAT